jgi:pyrroloquinoline-quinone synthase
MAPLKRVLQPEEIAGLAAYLASDDARSITGQAIVADASAEFRRSTKDGSVAEGLAALYAYESQIPEVSKTKREGLREFYGIEEGDATRFFSVHEHADVWHRQVERDALGRVADTPEARERALEAARRCCDALRRALDGVMRENGLTC